MSETFLAGLLESQVFLGSRLRSPPPALPPRSPNRVSFGLLQSMQDVNYCSNMVLASCIGPFHWLRQQFEILLDSEFRYVLLPGWLTGSNLPCRFGSWGQLPAEKPEWPPCRPIYSNESHSSRGHTHTPLQDSPRRLKRQLIYWLFHGLLSRMRHLLLGFSVDGILHARLST